jgi:hypothetical protein
MRITEVVKKLAELLNGRTIYFDLKSYSEDAEPPYLIVDGERKIVEESQLNKAGTYLEVSFADGSCGGFNFYAENDLDIDEIEKECGKMGIYNLLKDMYMETDESFDLGDFEQDFLGIDWWELSN